MFFLVVHNSLHCYTIAFIYKIIEIKYKQLKIHIVIIIKHYINVFWTEYLNKTLNSKYRYLN